MAKPPTGDVAFPGERTIALGSGLCRIPERLLLAHARGEVLFITGSGISKAAPSSLPDFRELTLRVYEQLDVATHAVLSGLPLDACNQWQPAGNGLLSGPRAEINRFIRGEYDVVLGMLERRMDVLPGPRSEVRRVIGEILRAGSRFPNRSHSALIDLADRGAALTIGTTNFDLLLEAAARRKKIPILTYSLGGIPRPGLRDEFAGVLHIHGALAPAASRTSDLIVTDQDFGEFYLRRRVVPDFIYDAARLFHLVLVGYSANDAPMRYLLNAVAADGSRFNDLKERFAFVGMAWPPDPVTIEDWKGRGITPIPYSEANGHAALADTLVRWSELSANSGRPTRIDALLKRIVRTPRASIGDDERDLFDHMIRRGGSTERARFSRLVSAAGAEMSWLDAIVAIEKEPRRERA